MNEIDKLAPEVREAIEVMDRLNTVTGSWNLLRAELVRFSDVEAELAALKTMFAGAPRVKDQPGTWDTIEQLRSIGYVDGMAIALLPVEE